MSITISADYVRGLLARALVTATSHEDDATRARADEKLRRFTEAISGMASGQINVGSRTPVADTPAWATLEVVKGGFATGSLVAGGPLLPHEEARMRDDAAKSFLPNGRTPRERLNLYFISEPGLRELTAMVDSGCYRITVPEEGALLVAAWLLKRGDRAAAWTVIDAVGPFFDRLRFYPVPDELPLRESSVVRLAPVSTTIAVLGQVETPDAVNAMNETLRVWIPLEDRLVAFFGASLDAARFDRSAARALHDEYVELAKRHTLSKRRHTSPKENLARLIRLVDVAAERGSLGDADLRLLRSTLAAITKKRGALGSTERGALRGRQQHDAALPTRGDVAHAVVERLRPLPADAGLPLPTFNASAAPISDDEGARHNLVPGTPLFDSIVAKLERSLEASIEELVERGVISSSEVLAIVAPQITAQVRASAIDDPDLRLLYGAIYAAFRRRRSLLLLNYEHQVRIEELPWIAAVERHRKQKDVRANDLARVTLEQLAVLAMTSFPDVILPNKLLTELDALVKGAKLEIPVVEELAADIFMGGFTSKFVRAAKISAQLLRGTIYERYYGIPVERVLALPEPKKGEAPEFAVLCRDLAGVADDPNRWGAGYVARNGRIIEAQQILTTHNLAPLFDALDVVEKLRPRLPELARACFTSILRWHETNLTDWHAMLLRVKNSAYAWRQMMFFLSLSSPEVPRGFVTWAGEQLAAHGDVAFRERFAPAMRGLAIVVAGGALDEAAQRAGARRFLGWTTERHWLFPPK
jgi:hypothetical protein